MTEKTEITLDTTPPVEGSEAPASEVTYGGYKTVEELVAAHAELTAKQVPAKTAEELAAEAAALEGTKTPLEIPEGDAGAQKVVEGAGLDWAALNTEYAADGKLSEETYASLEKAGLPRSEVDTYIQGKQAQADAYDAAVYGTAGGAESYASLVTWAKSALSEADKVAFNDAVTSGDAAKAKLAVEALSARHAKTHGTPPTNLLNGKKAANGVDAFKSQAEVTTAMNSRQYKTDPAFRATVLERLALSEF
jgi:hypothetical protein